jgi:hypothetical protein
LSNAKKLIKKIKTAYQVSTNPELANKLELTVSAIEQWSKKNKVPEKYIFKCITDTGVSMEWLLDEDKPTFHISGGKGVVALQTNHGDGSGQHNTFGSEEEKSVKKKENNIDEGTFGLFKEAYVKAKTKGEINRLRLYLMEFK